jgi:hypothetical protein
MHFKSFSGPFDARFVLKAAPDGRMLFFPWGAWGRGYHIASEDDYRRLCRQMKLQRVSWFLLIVLTYGIISSGSPSLKGYVIVILIILILIVLNLLHNVVWVRYWLPRLQPSDERYERLVPLQESMTFVARPFSVLWALEIVALAGVGASILPFIFDPSTRFISLPGIVFFGFAAVFFAFMLVLRRRPVRTRS